MSKSSSPLGIVGSSGGSALAAANQLLQQCGQSPQWVVVTDRQCGLRSWADSHAVAATLFEYRECGEFSKRAYQFFTAHGVTRALLFFTRRIGDAFFAELETCNIHPSLLPDLPGLGAVAKAVALGRPEIGATLHKVDENFDSGPILCQIRSKLPQAASLPVAERISYVQKVYLTLWWWHQAASPGAHRLSDDVLERFEWFREQHAPGSHIYHVAPK